MPRGSKPGERRGGRQKGTPNKRTADYDALYDSLVKKFGCPVTAMFKIAHDETVDMQHRMAAMREVTRYKFPTKKAVEHSGQVDMGAELLASLKRKNDGE